MRLAIESVPVPPGDDTIGVCLDRTRRIPQQFVSLCFPAPFVTLSQAAAPADPIIRVLLLLFVIVVIVFVIASRSS